MGSPGCVFIKNQNLNKIMSTLTRGIISAWSRSSGILCLKTSTRNEMEKCHLNTLSVWLGAQTNNNEQQNVRWLLEGASWLPRNGKNAENINLDTRYLGKHCENEWIGGILDFRQFSDQHENEWLARHSNQAKEHWKR